ncbi:hypothetical protein V5799_025741 [Amblyomma americanum]|uniref:Uncharacterized protein n=1 Tax=Amblyomma americanum TaxID=6943 RepID=A0AAQ4E8F9_AMBAM
MDNLVFLVPARMTMPHRLAKDIILKMTTPGSWYRRVRGQFTPGAHRCQCEGDHFVLFGQARTATSRQLPATMKEATSRFWCQCNCGHIAPVTNRHRLEGNRLVLLVPMSTRPYRPGRAPPS